MSSIVCAETRKSFYFGATDAVTYSGTRAQLALDSFSVKCPGFHWHTITLPAVQFEAGDLQCLSLLKHGGAPGQFLVQC